MVGYLILDREDKEHFDNQRSDMVEIPWNEYEEERKKEKGERRQENENYTQKQHHLGTK